MTPPVRILPALFGLLLLGAAGPTFGQKLLLEYPLSQSVSGGAGQPPLQAVGGSFAGGAFRFAAGQGLHLAQAGVTDQYSLELTFRLNEVDGYRKILDFKNRTEDQGLYVYSGALNFYRSASGGTVLPGVEYTLRLDRDRATQTVRAYLNKELAFQFPDPDGSAVLQNGSLWLFLDDRDGGEQGSGTVRNLRISDAPPNYQPLPLPPPGKLLRDFQFQGTLKDGTRQGPELTRVQGGMVEPDQFRFAAGDGLDLEDVGVSDHYAVEITFTMTDVQGYRKIIDFSRRESDGGLYVFNGQVTFYQRGTGGAIRPGQPCTVRLERDRRSGEVRCFVDGVRAFEFPDVMEEAVFPNRMGTFFQDDLATELEQGAGTLRRLRVWDGPGNRE